MDAGRGAGSTGRVGPWPRRHPTAADVAVGAVASFAGNLAFPRLAHRLRWPTRLGPRGLALYIAANTVFIFALRTWVLPQMRRMSDEYEAMLVALRRDLGREPTQEELFAAWEARG